MMQNHQIREAEEPIWEAMRLDMSPFFQSYKLKTMTLKNRFVMAPMTRLASPNGVPTDDMAAYYERRAQGQMGLVISEGTVVNRPSSSTGWPDIPRFHGEESLTAWKRILDRVHTAGAKMAPQVWHMGVQRENPEGPKGLPMNEGPSTRYALGKENGREMSEQDIIDTIAAFAASARESKRLGFDCVEIHAAHGYLIDQFFWDVTNTRGDQYGGKTLAARSRFAIDLVKAVRREVGEDFPISMRL